MEYFSFLRGSPLRFSGSPPWLLPRVRQLARTQAAISATAEGARGSGRRGDNVKVSQLRADGRGSAGAPAPPPRRAAGLVRLPSSRLSVLPAPQGACVRMNRDGRRGRGAGVPEAWKDRP